MVHEDGCGLACLFFRQVEDESSHKINKKNFSWVSGVQSYNNMAFAVLYGAVGTLDWHLALLS